MLQIKNILYATDFSGGSEAAYPHAAFLARLHDAELHPLHVAAPSVDPSGLENAPVKRVASPSNELFSEHLEVEAPSPARGLLDYIARHNIDLVVMGTHGHGGLGRFLLGSTAERVVRGAPCPVLTLRLGHARRVAPEDIKTILVPIDFSRYATIALRYAHELAATYNARLELLHVIEETLHPAFYNSGVFSIYDLIPDIEERAREELRTLFSEAGGSLGGVRYSTRYGHAAHEIIQHTRDCAIDMVVLATHGLRGMEHFILGSVAERVLRHSACPVFTVKGFGKSLLPEYRYDEVDAALMDSFPASDPTH